jgi:hypothetical protein
MTSKSKTVSAVVALASLAAGASMAAIAMQVEGGARAWNETRSLAETSPIESPGAVMPFVPPQAPFGEVNIGAVTYELNALPVAQRMQRPRLKQTCVPYWRELVEGPVGRHVAITCPGGPEPPPPPPSAERVSGLIRLPSLADLRSPLPRGAIQGGRPSAEEALAAGRSVAASLAERRGVSTEPTPSESPERLLPASNALGWRACSPEERTASTESEAGGRC